MNTVQIEQRLEISRQRQRPPVRRAVGRSLVRLGSRLAGEGDPSLEPARSR
jgi:hypothetical protein